MRQEVNLYQPFFRPHKDPFRSRTLILVLFLVLLGLGSLWILKASRVSSLQVQVEAAVEKRQQLKNRIQKLQAQYPKPKVSSRLKKRVSALRQGRKDRLRLLKTLEDRIPESETGFSVYLFGLARQKVDGVWLRRFEILLDDSEQLLLEGRSRKARLIPRYLQKLSHERPFSGIAFDTMRLERVEDQPEVIGFRLATRSGGQP